MTTRHLVDRQIAPLLNMFPQVELAGSLIAEVREKADAAYAFLPPPAITPEVMTISSAHGGPDIAVYLYRPSATKPGSGAILYIHGGGMVMGSARRIQTSPATLAASMPAYPSHRSNIAWRPNIPSPRRRRIAIRRWCGSRDRPGRSVSTRTG
ncbi:hypothetical protein [Sphingopyxis sp. PET50]|uniref:hypothetical protein n=1 Tax=Sphingopyxis sp. PET50 TaxID=2976533 RepID=UPI0021AEAA62|nr:hypothetical protein [Sphingopyxis sp. PET50]